MKRQPALSICEKTTNLLVMYADMHSQTQHAPQKQAFKKNNKKLH